MTARYPKGAGFGALERVGNKPQTQRRGGTAEHSARGEVGVAAAREELQIPGGVTPRGGRGGLGRGGPERD